MFHKTLFAFAAAVALGCGPIASSALAANHPHGAGGHASRGNAVASHARGGRIGHGYAGGRGGRGYSGYAGYSGCPGYGYGYADGCPGYYGDAPIVGAVLGGILGGRY